MAKERRGRFGGFSPDLDREGERAQRRKLWEEALLRDAAARPSDTARVKTLLARLDDWAEAQQHRTDLPCKVTRVAREIALANLSPLMTPQAALTYASWMMASERGWAHQESLESPESSPDLSSPEPPKLSAQGALASCFGFLAAPAPTSPGASVLAARLRPDAGAPGEAPSEAVLEEVLALARADGPGDPLPVELLTVELRKQLGEAATRVRLHTGAAANQAAQRLGASAFTVEHDIYFAAGAYAPGTSEGDRLLRHELTHVGQHERGLLAGATGAEMVASSSSAEAEALAAENAEPAEPAETTELVEWAGVRRPAHARAGKPGRPAAGSVEAPYVRLRSQLLEAAATGGGAEAALAAAEPAVAATVLRELRGTPVPGQNATALQLIARSAGAQVSRLLGGGVGAPAALASAAPPAAPPVAPPVASQVSQARFDATGGAEAPAASGRPGRPLEEEARRKMEFAFGTDFANVRILEGTEAQAMGAVAFARGEDLHFAPGQYDPGSWQGLELIGHELAHVVQQRAGRVAMGKGGVNTDPSLEREADDLGGRAARGERVATAGSASRDASAASWAEVETPGAELRAPSPGSAVEAEGSAAPAARAPDARLRGQLLEAAAAGRGADDALAAAEPATAERVLRELRGTSVPGHGETALQLVARRAETPIIGRLIGQGSRGQALPAAVAEELSPFVGPQVTGAAQLHTGEAADLLAAAHHARAVTIGDQIYFAHGQFAPGTEPGDELLVHELTHVDQAQRGELNTAAAKSITSGEALTPTEAEADLRARFAVIELHGPTAPLPALAAPSAQPTTEGERATKLAAQQTRVALAQQDDIPNTPTPPPPALTASGSAPGLGGLGNVMSAIRDLVSDVAADVAAGVSTVSATINATTAPSVGAYAETFDAPPSVQAFGLWDATGAKATTQAAAEQTRFDAALPERLNGPAAAAAPPAPSAAPAAPAAPAAAAATPPPAPAATVPPAAVAPPTVIAAPVSTTATAQGFEELPSTLEVEPSPGVPLLSELAGATDPVLAQIGQHQGAGAAVTAFTAAKEQILSGPGPALVQPTVLDEKLVVARSQAIGAMPGLPVVPEMAQLKQWNLPSDALAGFDGIVGPRMHAHLTQARTQMTTAEVKRDVDRSKAVDDGKAKARQAHLDASKQQQTKVAESRIQIATHQSSALLKHDAEFKKLDAQSDEQKKTTVGQVDARVKADQAKVESDFAIAQQQAVDAKGAAEAEVARLKAEGQAQYDAEEANAPPQPTEPKPEEPAQMRGLIGWIKDEIVDPIVDVVEDGVEWVGDNIVDPVVEGLKNAWKAFEDFVVYLANKLVELVKSIGEAIDNALRLAAEAIGTIIDTVKQLACTIIDAARDFLCEALRLFGEWLTSAITLLLGSVFPELAAALNALIDAAVSAATAAINAIADGLKSVVTVLCDTVKTAIDTAITLYRTAVQLAVTVIEAVVTGDWSQIALAALEAVLKLLGIDPEAFYAFVGKTKDSIVKILSNPGAFVRNLVEAVKLGFQQFGDNFLTHLKNGVVEWLFGTFAEAGIQMPTSFDVAGVFYLVAQVLGLSWPSLRGKVAQQVGQENPDQLAFVEKYLEPLLAGDFSGLWEQLQGDLSTLWETVIGGAKQWLMEQLVTQAILKIATMWNPAGALVELIRTAWHVYQWVRENAQRIKELLGAVVDSIAAIVAGNISGAANSIEASLAKLVPITISLFAHLLGIGGIAGKMKTIVLKVSAKVEQAIAKLIARVKARFVPKKPTTGTGTNGESKPDPNKPVGDRITFKVRSATHTQYIDKGVPMVASTPSSVEAKIDEWRPFLSEYPAADRNTAGSLIGKVIAIERKVDTLVSQVQAGTAQDSALVAKQRELADALSELWTFLLNLPPVIATGTMMGEGHTLTADPDPAKPEIRLASVEQEALTKVQAAITQAQGMDVLDPTKNKAVQALQKIRSELVTLQNLVTRAISNNAVDVVPQFQLKKQMEASAKAIMDLLEKYGTDFKVHDVIDLPQFTTDEDYRLLAEDVGQARLVGAFTSWTKDVEKSGLREGEKVIWENFAIVKEAASAPALAALAALAKGDEIQTKKNLSDALKKKGGSIKEDFHRTAGDQVVEQVKDQGKEVAESVETKAAIDTTAYVPNAFYGTIETPKAKPAPEPALKEAVANAGGIVAFMKGMATDKEAGGMTYAQLVEAWKIQANVNWLKDQFRAANSGQHEWIPSNMILEVIDRAKEIKDALHAAAWIDLHHTLRSPTPNLIFKPSYALGEVSIEGQEAQILSGHVGAVYYPGDSKKIKLNSGAAATTTQQSTIKQKEWHDELRRLFRTNDTIGAVITAMEDFFKETIWNGNEGDVPAAVFRDYVTSTGDPVDWNGLVAAQKGRYEEVQGNFDNCRAKLTAFLNS